MKVRLITKTVGVQGTEYDLKTLDEILVGIARLSSSRETNELFDEPYKLIRHCILSGHWSVYGEANLTFEVITSRAMGRELIRHWSLKLQEFSQRYSDKIELEPIELRRQSKSNRQSSTVPIKNLFLVKFVNSLAWSLTVIYRLLIRCGVSRETARFILPETTQTKINANGTVREWVTFLHQRLHKTAQKEIREVAEAIRDEFIKELPLVSKALFNFEDAYDIPILDRIVLEKYKVYDQIKGKTK